MKQSLKQFASALLLCEIGLLSEASACALPVSFVHRTLDCGSISVTSDTQLASLNDVFEAQGLDQTVRLTNVSPHESVTLPIFQHWSRSKKLDGRMVLDGLVWAFECVTSTSGETYVKLLWSCSNPEAKTCEEAMSIRDEWTSFYDRHGRPLPADPRNMTPADEQHIRQLGLWPSFIQDDLDRDGGLTYFYKQIAPNGHIR